MSAEADTPSKCISENPRKQRERNHAPVQKLTHRLSVSVKIKKTEGGEYVPVQKLTHRLNVSVITKKTEGEELRSSIVADTSVLNVPAFLILEICISH